MATRFKHGVLGRDHPKMALDRVFGVWYGALESMAEVLSRRYEVDKEHRRLLGERVKYWPARVEHQLLAAEYRPELDYKGGDNGIGRKRGTSKRAGEQRSRNRRAAAMQKLKERGGELGMGIERSGYDTDN